MSESCEFEMERYFKHKKTGKIYILICVAFNCTNSGNNEPYAVYRGLLEYKTYVRELEEFRQKFTEI